MKKLVIGGGIVVALGVVALVVASFFLGSIVKAGVNRYGPPITETRVTLAGASISPFSGSGTLRGFVVGNPKGWSNADLVSLGRVHVAVVPKSLFGDHVVIQDIDIDAPEFDYETRVTSSNVGDLLANVERAEGGSATTATAKNGKPMRFEVRRFQVRNGVVRFGAGAAAVRVPLPPVDLTDIGTAQGGITSAQLAMTLTRTITTDILRAGTQAATKAATTAAEAAASSAAGQKLKGAADKVKGLFSPRK
ncbi:MAG: hypothetical protein ACRENQ_12925 [Gemmatimonadaceae bacterium]